MSSAHKTTNERWLAALKHDDFDEAQGHFSGKVRGLQDVRLAQALAHDPLPVNILGGMVTEGLFHTHWVERVMDVGLKMDWQRALEWRAAHSNGTQLDRELKAAIHTGMNQYVSSNGRGRLTLERMLIGLLNFRPDLGKHIDASGTVHYSYFFRLSKNKESGNWLARSGLDVGKVLAEAIQLGLHADLLLSRTAEEMPGDRLNEWLERSPMHRQAWELLARADRVRMSQEEEWQATWLPEGQWKGSPLEAWCSAGPDGRKQEPSPLDEPALLGLDGAVARHDIEVCAKDYAAGLGYDHPESMRVRARRMNNVFRARAFNMPGQTLLNCPLDILALGLAHRYTWAAGQICEDEGARNIQALMLKDRRVMESVDRWGVREVAEWTIKQPLWQSWRNQDGQSLLGGIVSSYTANKKSRPALPKFLVMKLARKAPELLNQRTMDGVRLLDQIELTPKARAEIDRALLNLESPRKPQLVKKKAGIRMM